MGDFLMIGSRGGLAFGQFNKEAFSGDEKRGKANIANQILRLQGRDKMQKSQT